MGDAGLAAVTFDELAALVRQEMDGGYETEKQEGRRRLLQVIEELAAVPEETDHLLVGRTWRITKVHVAGVGGIETLTPGPLTLVPTSGVTVVRGPNGHGKTSLARAIDCGLRGDRDLPDEAAGELWAADLLTEGVAAAAIELTLVSGSDRLIIQATFGRTGPPAADATLIDDRGARLVDIGEPWRRALLSGRAYYSYGALQSRLTENKALQGYLEELLILGPAWERVRKEITVRADRTTQAQKAVDTARRATVHEEAALAARFAADTRVPSPPAPVAWPQARDGVDVDRWLRDTGLDSAEAPGSFRVDPGHEARVAELARTIEATDDALAVAERVLEAPGLATALHHLEQIMDVDELDDRTCPLCGTATDWRAHARQLTSGLQDRRTAANATRTAVTALATWVDSVLVPLLTADLPGGPHAEVAAFRSAAVDGHHAHSPAHRQARPLLAALSTDAHQEWLDRLQPHRMPARSGGRRWRRSCAGSPTCSASTAGPRPRRARGGKPRRP